MKIRLRYIILQGVIIGAAFASYGRWQYHRGFDKGADAAICAFVVGMDGEEAAKSYDACKRAGGTGWIVEGFKASRRERDHQPTA